MTERRRIAMLSHLASRSAPTGAERSLALLAAGLAERGHEVAVAAGAGWALADELHGRNVRVEPLGARQAWLAYAEPRPAWVAALKALRFALPDPGRRALRGWISSFRPDVVHVNCVTHVGGAEAARGFSRVWHIREILPSGPRRRWYARRLRRAARIVAVSRAVAAWLHEEGLGERTTVVHNGVDVRADRPDPARARAAFGLAPDRCVIGCIGQLVPHKGVLEFIAAGSRAAREEPGLQLLIAGAGEPGYVAQLHRAAREAGEDRVVIAPPQPDGRALIAASDVVALTTLTPDPFPRSVLEAMAAGRPVAAFRGGGVPEMIRDGETGLLVDTGDVDGLATAFVGLARDPARRAAMGAAGAARAASDFSIERHVDAMERVLVGARP